MGRPLCEGIDDELVNARISIERPSRTGPGGDVVGTPAVLAADVPAIYEASARLFKDPISGRDVSISGVFAIDGLDAAGAVIPVKALDWVRYDDFAGEETVVEVQVVAPYLDGGGLIYIDLEVGAVGAAG